MTVASPTLTTEEAPNEDYNSLWSKHLDRYPNYVYEQRREHTQTWVWKGEGKSFRKPYKSKEKFKTESLRSSWPNISNRWQVEDNDMIDGNKFLRFTLAIECFEKIHLTIFFNGQGCATNSGLIRQVRDRSYCYGNLQEQSDRENLNHNSQSRQAGTIINSIKTQVNTFQQDAALHNN